MATKLLLANDELEKLRCKTCNHYLSVFPIYLDHKESGALCGRCPVLKTDQCIRDEAYENMAQFLLFPCCHKDNGCREVLNPEELQEHEINCEYRKFECPTKYYTKCDWLGATNELEVHFSTNHTDQLITNRTFTISFINSQKENLLLIEDGTLFVVTKEIDARKNKFWCSVKNINQNDSQNKLNYRLVLETPDKKYSHKFPMKRTTSEENSTQVTANFIHEHLDDPESIVARIEIHKSEFLLAEKENASVTEDYPPIDLDILSELECPICMEYMLPPIFQCTEGHSICNTCKNQIQKCPLCQKSIGSTQNYVLEKMTSYLIYPCKYHKAGCKYTGKTSIIQSHEQSCIFGPYSCPIQGFEECDWKDNIAKIQDHIENNHPEYVLETERVDIVWTGPNNIIEKCYLIKHNTNLFKLHFKYENEKFLWSTQYIGSTETCKTYKFDIDIVDNSPENLRQFARKQCVSLKTKEQAFLKKGTYAIMSLDQLDSYITTKFSFKVKIYYD